MEVADPAGAGQHHGDCDSEGGVLVAGKPQVPGLMKGLGVTFKTLTKTMTPKRMGGGANTVQYPHERKRRRPGHEASLPCVRTTAPCACCAPEVVPTGASTSKGTRSSLRHAAPVVLHERSTRSIVSTSTTRCACIAASVSRCARSTRCSGARNTN